MTPDAPSNVVRHLRAHGPAPVAELPRKPEAHDRHLGVNAFRLTRSHNSGPMGGPTVVVYYLDEHDRTAVLRAFLDAAPA